MADKPKAKSLATETYRRALEEHSKVATKVGPSAEQRRRVAEGEAAKHGLRIPQKEAKGRPRSGQRPTRKALLPDVRSS